MDENEFMFFSGQFPLELGPSDPNMSERENIRSLSLKFIQQRSYYENSQFYYTTTPGQLRLGNKVTFIRKAILFSSLL